MQREQDLLIDIEVPEGIELAHDTDGLPKTVAAEEPAPKAAPKALDAELLTKQIDEHKRRADDLHQARLKDQAQSQAAIDAERKARTAAEGERDKNTDLAMRAHWSRVNTEHQALEAHVTSTKHLADMARKEMRAAKEAGDLDREMAANEQLIEATADLRELMRGRDGAKAEVERAREAFQAAAKEPPREEPKVDEPPAPKQLTPDEWIDTVPEAVRPWLREHREYVTDNKLNRRAVLFAEDYGLQHGQDAINTAEFVKQLNDKFFPKAARQETTVADTEEDAEEIEVEEPKRRTTPSAPVSRNPSPTKPSGGGVLGKVRLTPDEQATATQMYPNMDRNDALKKYASNKARATADGMYLPRN